MGETGAVGSSFLLSAMEIDMIDSAVFILSNTNFGVNFIVYIHKACCFTLRMSSLLTPDL